MSGSAPNGLAIPGANGLVVMKYQQLQSLRPTIKQRRDVQSYVDEYRKINRHVSDKRRIVGNRFYYPTLVKLGDVDPPTLTMEWEKLLVGAMTPDGISPDFIRLENDRFDSVMFNNGAIASGRQTWVLHLKYLANEAIKEVTRTSRPEEFGFKILGAKASAALTTNPDQYGQSDPKVKVVNKIEERVVVQIQHPTPMTPGEVAALCLQLMKSGMSSLDACTLLEERGIMTPEAKASIDVAMHSLLESKRQNITLQLDNWMPSTQYRQAQVGKSNKIFALYQADAPPAWYYSNGITLVVTWHSDASKVTAGFISMQTGMREAVTTKRMMAIHNDLLTVPASFADFASKSLTVTFVTFMCEDFQHGFTLMMLPIRDNGPAPQPSITIEEMKDKWIDVLETFGQCRTSMAYTQMSVVDKLNHYVSQNVGFWRSVDINTEGFCLWPMHFDKRPIVNKTRGFFVRNSMFPIELATLDRGQNCNELLHTLSKHLPTIS